MSDYLANTTVLIDHFRGRQHVRQLLQNLAGAGHRLCCCNLTVVEIYVGMRPTERPATERFLSGLHYLPTSRAMAERAGAWCHEYRQTGVTVGIADALIAAVAEGHGAILLTANTRHFSFPGLVVQAVPSAP